MDYQKLKTKHEVLTIDFESLKTSYEILSKDFSALKVTVVNNERRDEEERKKNTELFNELYNSKNKTNEVLIELTSTVKNLVSNMDKQFNSQSAQFDKLEKKLDDLANEHRTSKGGN